MLLAMSPFVVFGICGCYGDEVTVVSYTGGPSEEIIKVFSDVYQGEGVDRAAPFTASPGLHPIVIYSLEDPGIRHVYNDILRDSWIPKSVESVQLVAYVGNEEQVTIERCLYTGGYIKTRYQYQRTIELYAAHDAALIKEETIMGSLPDRCPTFTDDSSDIHGTRVLFDEVTDWLRAYVEG
jgi:hypothetical protein